MKKLLAIILFSVGIAAASADSTTRTPLGAARPMSEFKMPDEPKTIAPYISGRIGGASLSIDDNNYFGGTYAGAMGARFIVDEDMAVRIEGEFGILSFGDSIQPNGSAKNHMTFMANLYLDLMTDQIVKPYVGVGVGFTNYNDRVQAGGARVLSAFEAELIWGLYGGIGFNLTKSGALAGDVGVRYSYASIWGYSVASMTYNAGLRFTF